MNELRLEQFIIKSVYGVECVYAPSMEDAERLYKTLCPYAYSRGITIRQFPGYADENCFFMGTREEWFTSACSQASTLSFGLDHGERKIEPEIQYGNTSASSGSSTGGKEFEGD